MVDKNYQLHYSSAYNFEAEDTAYMLLTKECDYGLRIMRVLSDGKIKTVRTICELEHIPFKYSYKILKKLQKAGLVQNKLGPSGGYILIKPLNSFSMYDVAIAVDEDLFLFECLRKGKQCPNNNKDTPCNVHLELIRIQESLVSEMKAKSMEEVLSQTT